MANGVIERLVAQLGFEIDSKDLDKFQDSLKSATQGINRLAAAGAVLVASAGAIVRSVASSTREQEKMADRIGTTVRELQVLRNTADLAGESADGMAASLETITKALQDSGSGLSDAWSGFARLGIELHDANGEMRSSADLIEDIIKKGASVPPELFRLAASEIGLDATMFENFINMGIDEFRRFNAEAEKLTPQISDETIATYRELDTAVAALRLEFRALRDEISHELAESALEVARGILEIVRAVRLFAKENPKVFFGGLFAVLGAGSIAVVLSMALALLKLGAVFAPLIALTKFLGGALLALGAPFLLKAAIIGGVVFVLQDLLKWLRGGESVIGSFASNIRDKFSGIFDGLIEGIPFLKETLELIESVLDIGKSVVSSATTGAIDLLNYIPGVNISAGEQLETVPQIQQVLGASGVPAIGQTQQTPSNNSVTNNINVRIDGNATAEDVRRGINESDILELTTDNLASQVAR